MKKIVFLWAALALLCQPADAQLFKKLFKKKAKTEKKTEAKADGIDDALQLALADITTADNANNRNAFLGIPVGIKADRFEKQLFSLNFKEQKDDGPHTGKSYIYEGMVYGQTAVVTLAVSEQTARVYAVDVQESTMYNKQSVVKRFNELKSQIAQTYGRGYVDNQGAIQYRVVWELSICTTSVARGWMSILSASHWTTPRPIRWHTVKWTTRSMSQLPAP